MLLTPKRKTAPLKDRWEDIDEDTRIDGGAYVFEDEICDRLN